MDKPNKLTSTIKSFADKITGTSRIDNAANPSSAYSMLKRKQANTLPRNAQAVMAKKVK